MLEVNKIKKDFPIFREYPKLVYLDSAATSLKPKVVIEKIVEYYQKYSANVFRGLYKISEKATEEMEETREKVAKFIGAENKNEIIFTKNTTEAINLLSYTLGNQIIKRGDEIALSIMEHHSNFIPWQQLAKEKKILLKIIDINKEGNLVILPGFFKKKTKILALTYVSNVLGTINPVKKIIREAKEVNPKIIIILDAAQTAPHLKIDVKTLGADFLAFSAHKMLGPTGLGVLWGREALLREMPPFNFGGGMVEEVSVKKTKFKAPPFKFEAGTPNIAEIVAFKESLNYLLKIGWEAIRNHEKELLFYCQKRLLEEFGENIKIFGPQNVEEKCGIISFSLKKIHPHDIAQILNENEICLRAGHHCALPLHKRLGISASARISFYIYNNQEDINRLINGLKKIWHLFTRK